MSQIQLSQNGRRLIKLYSQMVKQGFKRTDGTKVKPEHVYNSFQLAKFSDYCKKHFIKDKVNSVLDYGGGGSDWDAANFKGVNSTSAKKFFEISEVITYEPARNLMEKKKSDCVVCMDVLEHIFLADVPNIVHELYSLANKLLVVNVACYKASALLPNGENAHITIRSPDWWKGVFDSFCGDFPKVKLILICSTEFDKGVIYETFCANDWHSSKAFTVDLRHMNFSFK